MAIRTSLKGLCTSGASLNVPVSYTHLERRAFRDFSQRHNACECDSAVTLDSAPGNRGESAPRVRQAREYLERACKIQLRNARVKREDDTKFSAHRWFLR